MANKDNDSTKLLPQENGLETGRSRHLITYSRREGISVIGCEKCRSCCFNFQDGYCLFALSNKESRDERLKGKFGKYLKIEPKKKCANLTRNKCSCKPMICRIYPFVLSNGELCVDLGCPAVKTMSLYELREIGEAVAQELSKQDDGYLFRADAYDRMSPSILGLSLFVKYRNLI